MPRLPLLLIVAGLSAAVFSQIGTVDDLTVYSVGGGASGGFLRGVEWATRVPDIAGGLGLSAAAFGAISWRWPERALAAIVAVLLALGTALVLYWLVVKPIVVYDRAGEQFGYEWTLWAAAAALVVATIAAAALAMRRA